MLCYNLHHFRIKMRATCLSRSTYLAPILKLIYLTFIFLAQYTIVKCKDIHLHSIDIYVFRSESFDLSFVK